MLRLTGRGVPRSTTVTSTSSPGIRDSPGEGERREGWGGEGGVGWGGRCGKRGEEEGNTGNVN